MTENAKFIKPLGIKAYGSICHLPGSRLGPGDHKLNPGQAKILTEKARDKHDRIIVQEKLDGSNVAIARVNGVMIPIGRAGYPAITSPYEQHKLFATWLFSNLDRFEFLEQGQWLSGEWLAQAACYLCQQDEEGRDNVTLPECLAYARHMLSCPPRERAYEIAEVDILAWLRTRRYQPPIGAAR